MTVATVLGARPQFVKAAAVSAALRASELDEVVIHTGQHFDDNMSGSFFSQLSLPTPAYNLGVHGGHHGQMTGRMLEGVETVLLEIEPSVVLVYGDTNSTLAGALAASKLQLPLAHVEAGLRSFNRSMPEEINRIVTDHLADVLFCPTTIAVRNLAAEGIHRGVHHVGDVMYDACRLFGERARETSTVLQRLGLADKKYAVATVHRSENTATYEQLTRVLDYVRGRARSMPVVFPLHPRTAAACSHWGIGLEQLLVVPPLSYLDMTRLVQGAALVLTDSGGLQKEAYFHRVPCVTLRSETEWVETIEAGWNSLWQAADRQPPRTTIPEYGEGRSAAAIADVLSEFAASPGAAVQP